MTEEPTNVAEVAVSPDTETTSFEAGFETGGLGAHVAYAQPVAARSLSDDEEEGPSRAGTVHWIGLLVAALIAMRQGVSVRQLIFQVALPVFFLTQVVGGAFLWLRGRERLGRGSRHLMSAIDEWGGGFYGVMALLAFLRFEFFDLKSLWAESSNAWDFVSGLGLDRIFNFGVSSFVNGFQANFWPFYGYREFGREALWLVLFAWLIYRATTALARPWLKTLATRYE